ncbi:MAG: FAD-dependent oxidoreductase, partial [Elusimicrobia bacterium]|nr:FAD-dependent oxidoreductase [Elusimicrobiota bacterium]
AGLSGLSTAYHLEGKKKYIIIEKESKVGGLASSVEKNGFVFDYSGHLLHIRSEYAKKLVFRLLKDNLLTLKRNSLIYINGIRIPYPFQINLKNLPDKIKSECVRDFIRVYKLRQQPSASDWQLSFKEWALRTFGRGICKYFMFPYNAKLWQYPLDKLTADWCAPFVPVPSLIEVLEGAFLKEKTGIGYNPVFYYPEKGGIQALPDAMAGKIENLKFNAELTRIDLQNKVAHVRNLGYIKFKYLVNTIPLKDFVLKIENAPDGILMANSKLKVNSVDVLNLGAKNVKSKIHWTYYPEARFPFYRVGIASNFSKQVSPAGMASFYIETAAPDAKSHSKTGEIDIIKNFLKCGFVKRMPDITEKLRLKIPNAYVIYNKDRQTALSEIMSYLVKYDIFSIGRYGGWKYSFMEENIMEGKETAEKILNCRCS